MPRTESKTQNQTRDEARAERREAIRRLIEEKGYTPQEVAGALGLKINNVYHIIWRHGIRLRDPEAYDGPDPFAPDPNYLLTDCQLELGTRLRAAYDHRGVAREYRLDGRPAGFGDVVKAANRIRKAKGEAQIGNNPEWWQ